MMKFIAIFFTSMTPLIALQCNSLFSHLTLGAQFLEDGSAQFQIYSSTATRLEISLYSQEKGKLAAAKMPILILRGVKSLVWSHEEFEKERAHFATWPSVRFEEFAGAGHGLPFEKRLEFLKRLREWI